MTTQVSQPQVICTLGMHRSGTSVVSRTLNLLGVHLGPPETTHGKGDDNPKGYWEHHPIALLNDEILETFGGRWDQPPVFPDQWWRGGNLDDLKVKARGLLDRDFAGASLWGWKDPRTCLTLPFWQSLVPSMRYVVCLRNPRSVVASLARRNGMCAEAAERLWLVHVHSSLAYTSGQDRMFVFYEDMIGDWQGQLERLAAFIGDPHRINDPVTRAAFADFLETELCHHRASVEDLVGDAQVSFATKGLYLALRGDADFRASARERGRTASPVPARQRVLDSMAHQALDLCDRTRALHAERDRLIAHASAQSHRLAAAQQTTAWLEAQVAETAQRAASAHAEREALAREKQAIAAVAASVRADLGTRESRATAAARQLASLSDDLAAVTAERELQARRCERQAAAIATLRLERERLLANVETISVARFDAARERDAAFQTIHEIQTSAAWRVVTVCRRVIVALLPYGTRRRDAFTAVLRRLTHRMPAADAQAVADAPAAVADLRTS